MDIGIKEAIALTGLLSGAFGSVFAIGGQWAVNKLIMGQVMKRLDKHDDQIDDHEHRLSRVEVVCAVNHPEKARG